MSQRNRFYFKASSCCCCDDPSSVFFKVFGCSRSPVKLALRDFSSTSNAIRNLFNLKLSLSPASFTVVFASLRSFLLSPLSP